MWFSASEGLPPSSISPAAQAASACSRLLHQLQGSCVSWMAFSSVSPVMTLTCNWELRHLKHISLGCPSGCTSCSCTLHFSVLAYSSPRTPVVCSMFFRRSTGALPRTWRCLKDDVTLLFRQTKPNTMVHWPDAPGCSVPQVDLSYVQVDGPIIINISEQHSRIYGLNI